jgi:hypothetical protein
MLGFVGFLATIFGLPVVLTLPAFLHGRRHEGASWALFGLAVPAFVVWGLLIHAGVGAQSLANVVELYLIGAVAGAVACLQVFVIDPRLRRPGLTTGLLAVALAGTCVVMRLAMPNLPE